MGEENIRPKSIAREMFEQFRSFTEYVLDYDLQRSEGLLLRHLNSVYKVLSQTVPDPDKTDEVLDLEHYLRTMLRQVDSSLEDEWHRMRDPAWRPFEAGAAPMAAIRLPGAPTAEAGAVDVTRDTRRFTAAVRARIFLFLRAWWTRDHAGALAVLDDAPDESAPGAEADEVSVATDAWTADRLQTLAGLFGAGRGTLRFDPEARNARHTHVTPSEEGRSWRVQQMLVDPDMVNDWAAEFDVDLDASRDRGQPVMRLERIGPIA